MKIITKEGKEFNEDLSAWQLLEAIATSTGGSAKDGYFTLRANAFSGTRNLTRTVHVSGICNPPKEEPAFVYVSTQEVISILSKNTFTNPPSFDRCLWDLD